MGLGKSSPGKGARIWRSRSIEDARNGSGFWGRTRQSGGYQQSHMYKEWLEELKRAAELAGAGNEELAEMKRAYRQGGIRQSPGFN